MSRKILVSTLIAAASLVSAHAFAADSFAVEAVRGEQQRQSQMWASAVAGTRSASTNDFLQEAERGEYLRSVAASSPRAAQGASARDALAPAEATRGATL